jgi:hypothetical protein
MRWQAVGRGKRPRMNSRHAMENPLAMCWKRMAETHEYVGRTKEARSPGLIVLALKVTGTSEGASEGQTQRSCDPCTLSPRQHATASQRTTQS